MPRMRLETAVTRAITRILAKRRELERAIARNQARLAEIDALFTDAGLAPPAETGGARPRTAGAKTNPAAKAPARRKLHRNSNLYKAKVAALQKARQARWAKHRAAKSATAAGKH
jgi:hypothetical protein